MHDQMTAHRRALPRPNWQHDPTPPKLKPAATARIARLATLAVMAATVVGAVGCSSSNDHNSATPSSSVSTTHPPVPPPPPVPPAPPPPTDYVEGMISSFEGNVLNLRTREGSATVDLRPATEIIETTPGQLSDIVPGSCVDVHQAPPGAPGTVTAQSVSVSPAEEGKCPPPPPEPGPAGAPPPGGGPAANPGVDGKVDSVSDNTINVVSGPGPQTKVTVTDTTSYSKVMPVGTEALTNGKCLSAEGDKNGGGVLQASMIDLQPCPPMGRPHHRLHLPFHLPHRHHG
jgi:hypothetical protein